DVDLEVAQAAQRDDAAAELLELREQRRLDARLDELRRHLGPGAGERLVPGVARRLVEVERHGRSRLAERGQRHLPMGVGGAAAGRGGAAGGRRAGGAAAAAATAAPAAAGGGRGCGGGAEGREAD